MMRYLLLFILTTSTASAAMFVKPSIACQDGTKYYPTKEACEAAEGVTCQNFETYPLSCRDQAIADKAAKEAAKAAKKAQAKDDWQNLSTTQKIELLRDLIVD